MELYDYQQSAIHDLRQCYAGGFSAPLLVLPTGGGKTVCFTYMAQQASRKTKRVLLLAHRKELVAQISAALGKWDVGHGIIAPGATPSTLPVQVAMAQTLARRVKMDTSGRFKFDLVIIDECHHATRDSIWGAVLEHNAGAKLLGVSATPCRLDGKGLGVDADGFFDAIVTGPTVDELIAKGRLCPPVVFVPEEKVDVSKVKKRGGDYISADLAAAMDNSRINEMAVRHYRERLSGQASIAFTVTVDHAEHVAQAFKDAGYAAAVLSGKTPDKQREGMIRDLGNGTLHVLASCNVVSEGTDIPSVAGALLLRPTASYSLAMQQMGRTLRTAEGKDRAVIMDIVGNSLRHGLPSDPVEWSLDGAKRGGASERVCFSCRALIPSRATVCPGCGRSVKAETGVGRPADVEAMQMELPLAPDGKLVELTPERRALMKQWRRRVEKEAKTIDEFRAIAAAMGYRPKWADYRYEELRGARG